METFDIRPDPAGLIRFIRHIAETDKPVAMKFLVDGWEMTTGQAQEILDGASLAEILHTEEVTG